MMTHKLAAREPNRFWKRKFMREGLLKNATVNRKKPAYCFCNVWMSTAVSRQRREGVVPCSAAMTLAASAEDYCLEHCPFDL
jgi:hypothetical protein